MTLLVEYVPPGRKPGDEPGDVIEIEAPDPMRRPSEGHVFTLTYEEAKKLTSDLYRAMNARNRHPAHNHRRWM